MDLAFLATTLLMSVAGLAFVLTPLVRVQRARTGRSVNLPVLGILVVFGLGIALYSAIGRPDASLLTGLEGHLESIGEEQAQKRYMQEATAL